MKMNMETTHKFRTKEYMVLLRLKCFVSLFDMVSRYVENHNYDVDPDHTHLYRIIGDVFLSECGAVTESVERQSLPRYTRG
jgi:hypothetical protein